MRLIDADALKKDWSMANKCEECPQDARKCQYEQNFTRMDVCEMLDEAPTVGGWISVKDRMPDDGKFVLVCNDDKKMMVAKYESEVLGWEYKYTNYDWDVWDDKEQGPVCWWVPLPEPPKDGDA